MHNRLQSGPMHRQRVLHTHQVVASNLVSAAFKALTGPLVFLTFILRTVYFTQQRNSRDCTQHTRTPFFAASPTIRVKYVRGFLTVSTIGRRRVPS